MKHHINPKTGTPSACNAKVKCPFGGIHYGSLREAAAGNEAREKAIHALGKLSRGAQAMKATGLEAHGIYSELPIQIKDGEFKLEDSATLSKDAPIFVRQGLIYPAKVLAYVDQILEGAAVAPVQVTDIVPGGGHWHLNGLHRLMAHRLMGLATPAEIWR